MRYSTELIQRLLRGEVPVALVVAHPDDETVGAGAQLARWPAATVVLATDGAPRERRWWGAQCETREEYAELRGRELRLALTIAGVPEDHIHPLGLADQEASLTLALLACCIAERLHRIRPEVVLTHPYEGGHPDHDAVAFAVHAACRLLARYGAPAPAVVEFACYHDREGEMCAGEFLPQPDCEPVDVVLGRDALTRKREMYSCYASQRETLRYLPVGREQFRPAPRYRFTEPPHPGVLWYERWDWGMTGARWRELAGEALGTLELEDAWV